MKAEDLKTKTVDELKKLLLEMRKEQLNLRFQRSGGTLDNTSTIRKNRRAIARIKTFLTHGNAASVAQDSAKKAVKAKKTTKAKATEKAPAKKKATKKTEAA